MTAALHFRSLLTFLPFLLVTGRPQRREAKDTEEMTEEVEARMKRIEATKGVIGTLVVNPDGIPIRSTLDQSMTLQYAGQLQNLVALAMSTVRDIDAQNDLSALRVRSKNHEIIVVTENTYLVIAIQKLPE